MKRLFLRRGHSDADHIKNNADQDNGDQDQKRDREIRASQKLGRNKGHRTGNDHRQRKNENDPFVIRLRHFLALFLFCLTQDKPSER